MHRLLETQLNLATHSGQLDVTVLIEQITRTYEQMDVERRGIVRSMQLMSDEASALTRELKATTASQLQSILDHVKDAILTLDPQGLIATINATGQRIFDVDDVDVIGRPLAQLLPELAIHLCDQLDRLAARLDDTQTDLAPHETTGVRGGHRFVAEMAVSKIQVDGRSVYVVCLRDTTERKAADAALRTARRDIDACSITSSKAFIAQHAKAGSFRQIQR